MMNEMNTQIATAASQQSQVSEEGNQNVQRIAESTMQMVEMAAAALRMHAWHWRSNVKC